MKLLWTVLLSTLIQFSLWQPAQPQPLKKIRIGLQVATQTLVSGDPPIVSIGTVILANLQGYDIVLVASVESSYDQIVFVRPGTITRIEQIKGKKFGVSGFGSATHNAVLILLKKSNLEPNKDVALIPTGPASDRMVALNTGKVDATFFNPSEAPQAMKMGFVEIIQMADLGVEVQGSGLATARPFIKAHREIVKSAVKAYVEGIHFFYSNKQAAQKSLAKYMRTNDQDAKLDLHGGVFENLCRADWLLHGHRSHGDETVGVF